MKVKIRFFTFIASAILLGLLPLRQTSATCDLPARLRAAQSTVIPWNRKIDFAQVEKTLGSGKIKKMTELLDYFHESGRLDGEIPRFSHKIYVVEFEDGMKGIWKPSKDLEESLAEVGGYHASNLVGGELVPPTVYRSLAGEKGSMQYFVESTIPLEKKGIDAAVVYAQVNSKSASDRRLFQFVFGNWDNHEGNELVDQSLNFLLPDNGELCRRLQTRFGEVPYRRVASLPRNEIPLTPLDPATFPYDHSLILKNPTFQEFSEAFNGKLSKLQIAMQWRRVARSWEEFRGGLKGIVKPEAILQDWMLFSRHAGKDRVLKIAFWDDGVWMQLNLRGYRQPSVTGIFSQRTLDYYRALTPQSLRTALPEPPFTGRHLRAILERRDQVLKAAETGTVIP